jgi:hypothetical protein
MNRNIPGILYVYFYEDERYQLWALPIKPGTAADIQEAYDGDDWPQGVAEDIEEEYGAMDYASSPCDEVHGMGFFTSEVGFDSAAEVMNAWREGLIKGTQAEADIGEPLMLQEGAIDSAAEFSSDADIYELCVAV